MRFEQIIERIPGKKQINGNSARCTCPYDEHKDKQALSVEEKQDGTVVMMCHSCGKEATELILDCIGLKTSDLFNNPPPIAQKPDLVQKPNPAPLEHILQACKGPSAYPSEDHRYMRKKLLEGRSGNLYALPRGIAERVLDQSISSLSGDILFVPRFIDGVLHNFELIDELGNKRRIKGISDKNSYWINKMINGRPPECIYIGEGMATVQTVIMLKGGQNNYGIACGGIDNLRAVALKMRGSYPSAKIVLLGEISKDTGLLDDTYADVAQEIGAWVVTPKFSLSVTPGTDINDVYVFEQRANEDGKEAVHECFEQAESFEKDEDNPRKITEHLESMMLGSKEMEEYENPEFIIDNLIVRSHVLTINAMPGGGKTSIIRHLCPEMVEAGYKVIYINSDISGPDAKRFHEHAVKHKYTLLLPTLMKGDGENSAQNILMERIKALTKFDTRSSDLVFIFDTLKKFTCMMDKKTSSAFYVLQRELSGRGITIINLAHANKYRDDEGKIIAEGTGDHVADIDDQIFFEHWEQDDVLLVTTSKGVRARFNHQPMSFEVTDGGWCVEKLNEVVDVVQMRKDAKDDEKSAERLVKRHEKDEAAIKYIKHYIQSLGQAPSQSMIVTQCKGAFDYSRKKTLRILWDYCNENQNSCDIHWRSIKKPGENNAETRYYYVI